ncbi:MAG: glycosyltransferase family 39 protein [Bdellovibrionales bacterium]|nr:glycosyltransferase family 39 protein [Bdellovibrionales bacterium]
MGSSSWKILFLVVLGIYAILTRIPYQLNVYFAVGQFLFLTAIFYISSAGLGRFLLERVFKLNDLTTAFAVGFGFFAALLCLLNKITIIPAYYIPFLFFGLFYFIYSKYVELKKESLEIVYAGMFAFFTIVLLVIYCFTSSTNGFLAAPIDFDSGLFHVTFPKTVVLQGSYIYSSYLRVHFLPQLAHSWYIFFLSIFGNDEHFLRIINMAVFVQIVVLFYSLGKRYSIISLLMMVLLFSFPEMLRDFPTTNLDTVFTLFISVMMYQLIICVEDRKWTNLFLLTILGAFSAGQKHFGFIYSFPVFTMTYLLYIYHFWKLEKGKAVDVGRRVLLGSILFVTCTLPFYFHNLLSRTNLLFPFAGSSENFYGWSLSDYNGFKGANIDHWGHSKELLSFFTVPLDMLKFPEKFSYFKDSDSYEMFFSYGFYTLIFIFLLNLFSKYRRNVGLAILTLAILMQVYGWYISSQVIRYLLPVFAGMGLILIPLLHDLVKRIKFLPSFKKAFPLVVFFSSVLVVSTTLKKYKHSVQFWSSPQEREMQLRSLDTERFDSLNFLKKTVPSKDGILSLSPMMWTYIPHFYELNLCGDWFGVCRFDKYYDYPIVFKPWANLYPALKERNLRFIYVAWGEINGSLGHRPQTESELSQVFPSDTRQCLELIYHQGSKYEVYQVKQSCWQGG